MAGIVGEEPPANARELNELIGDFIKNGSKVSEAECEGQCAKIFSELESKKLIRAASKKWAAERMERAVTLQEIELIKS